MTEAIHGFSSTAFAERCRELGFRGAGKARELYRLALREGVFEPERVGLGAEACRAYRAHFSFALPERVRVLESAGPRGPTTKLALRLADGLELECVRIPMGRERFSLCVSTQVGCKMGCAFCETGRMGLLRQLSVAEIVVQLLAVRHGLGLSVKNIVFMGMGEPLDNMDGLLGALQVLNDPGGLAITQEHMTVCTVGHLDGIRRLGEAGYKRLNLSVSLNAANDALRSRLMPVNRRAPLRELKAALVAYRPRRNFALGVHYCLMPGLNDTREDARDVARFCDGLGRVLVQLIPYNPGGDPLTRAPEEPEVERFVAWLREQGLPVRRRVTKGRDVMAACGQLGNVDLRRGRAR
ncbi:MAG: 23S rRNA (adenine(2503)-C(2))-methyltransferase RlmN [Deltaproteobacteria bacterium]|nr:23S rRNA (adenine(2503)-C(2))-methyltransferase RlmN [Deltaproteobacteria bacterium]